MDTVVWIPDIGILPQFLYCIVMAYYHKSLVVYNIMHNTSSEQIKDKYTHQERHSQKQRI